MGSKTLPAPVPIHPSLQLTNYSFLQAVNGLPTVPSDHLPNLYGFSALHAVHLHQWTLGYPAMHLPRSSFSKVPGAVSNLVDARFQLPAFSWAAPTLSKEAYSKIKDHAKATEFIFTRIVS